VEEPELRFGGQVLSFEDPDGLLLELIETDENGIKAFEAGAIPAAYAINGFFGVTLAERNAAATAELLVGTMGLKKVAQEGTRTRYQGADGLPGAVIDLLDVPNGKPGVVAAGSVHHIAWRTPDDAQEAEWLKALGELNFNVSPVMDRIYFHSIYFREPGGVLFEIATDTPGFLIDESVDNLGSGLRLPPWLEPQRSEIEQAVLPLRIGQTDGRIP
jgi:glyoxalase family protein